ncbi:hypothetical protein BNCALIDO_00176 [Aeromonas phage vB_AdhM_TS9]|nr:hypothetical protein BNCALIDO_00176 [Aeromonas phage vB_AdhM_TS9]
MYSEGKARGRTEGGKQNEQDYEIYRDHDDPLWCCSAWCSCSRPDRCSDGNCQSGLCWSDGNGFCRHGDFYYKNNPIKYVDL